MILKSITIRNYRSIEELTFEINQLTDETYSYGLIGVNEAGKSTILKALALKDGLKNERNEPLPLQKDFNDPKKPIEVWYSYLLDEEEVEEVRVQLTTNNPSASINDIDFHNIECTVFFEHSAASTAVYSVKIDSIPDENTNKITIQEQVKLIIISKLHKAIFWTAEERYLISQPINLSLFASTPDDISIPLRNCFALAGIVGTESISARISMIPESTDRELLQNELGEKVTEHIKKCWPNHPIKITFDISDGLINFHVHDLESRGKAKTADQRSDGFKQFISFLLTMSAQSRNEELSNTILLLDEPETHLHPQAQIDLLNELIKITKNEKNNIVYFATHSNYMIDKKDLSRNYRIFKNSDGNTKKESTKKEQFDTKASTYASVTYDVFDIVSTDYHNELYAKIHECYQDQDPADKERERLQNFDENYLILVKGLNKDKPWRDNPNQVSLPTYIRNCIHHPDGGNSYSDEELRKSIELLKSYILP